MQFLIEHIDIVMFAVTIAMLIRGYPVAFTLAGVGLGFALIGAWLEVGYFASGDLSFLKPFYSRVYGLMDETNEVLVAVPLFIFMGVMLERSQVAGELLETMGRLFGRLPGGLGFAVTFVGMLLAASTGVVGATVVTMGMISLPSMLRYNYAPSLACGSIAASGTLGQIIPPSIVLIILGDAISNEYTEARRNAGDWAPDPVSVGDIFAGAMVPGLMLVGAYLLYQIAIAVFFPSKSPPMDARDADPVTPRMVLRVLVPPVCLIVAVLGSILAGIATPTEAASVGAVGSVLLAGARLEPGRPWPQIAAFSGIVAALILTSGFDLRVSRDVIAPVDRIAIGAAIIACLLIAWGIASSLWRAYQRTEHAGGPSMLSEVMRSTMRVSSMVFIILIGAQLFNLTFRGLGGDETVREILDALPGGPWGAIFAVMLVIFLLGFFLDFLEIVFVVVPITAPIIFSYSNPDGSVMFHPVWVAVMIAMNLQTSFLTPPFGFALFYLRGVTPPEIRTVEIYRGVIPFVFMQLLMLALLAAVPELATWLPTRIFG
ncbi:TRAP transporter large permease [Amaricoccus macauensis]|uniref:TRAP transporter large permease n=1 Tax=Amaricoccus macauensis TaxID=57001 RepID=UPI003C7A96C3